MTKISTSPNIVDFLRYTFHNHMEQIVLEEYSFKKWANDNTPLTPGDKNAYFS